MAGDPGEPEEPARDGGGPEGDPTLAEGDVGRRAGREFLTLLADRTTVSRSSPARIVTPPSVLRSNNGPKSAEASDATAELGDPGPDGPHAERVHVDPGWR